MIIYFMKNWPDGQPTHFKEKIKIGCTLNGIIGTGAWMLMYCLKDNSRKPKIHTLRESFRVKKGMMLDLAYWSGKPYRSSPDRFVEQTPCVNTQEVKIIWYSKNWKDTFVMIDGIAAGASEIYQLAINDGFESVDKFFEHFNKSKTYNLIHWTDKMY